MRLSAWVILSLTSSWGFGMCLEVMADVEGNSVTSAKGAFEKGNVRAHRG
jgi:hypothetical protein